MNWVHRLIAVITRIGCISFTRMKKTRSGFFSRGTCFLYAGVGVARDSKDADSGIIAPIVEDPEECAPIDGISFLGPALNNGASFVVENVGECCLRCQENEGEKKFDMVVLSQQG